MVGLAQLVGCVNDISNIFHKDHKVVLNVDKVKSSLLGSVSDGYHKTQINIESTHFLEFRKTVPGGL